jgi:DNA-binding NarL/FixJ family response regulator
VNSARNNGWREQDILRNGEKERLIDALDDLHSGFGGVIELVGEPGMGKTHLLMDLVREARHRHLRVLTGRSEEVDQKIPFHVIGQLLTRLSGNGATDEERAAVAGTLRGIREYEHAPGTPGEAGLAPSRPSDAVAQHDIRRSIRLLLERFSRGGLLMVFDDFHWADPASIDFLGELTRWPPDVPLLQVIAHRPRQASHRLRSAFVPGIQTGTVRRIELAPLTPAQSARLLDLPTGSPRLVRLHEEAHGNPLYLQALAAQREPEVGPAGRLDDLPEQTAVLLLGEIAFLDPAETAVVQAAAVLGGRFDVDALTQVAQMDRDRTCAAVAELTRRDLLRPAGTTLFDFRHPLIGRAIHQRLDPCWRQHAHRRALSMLAERGAPAAVRTAHVAHAAAVPGSDLEDLRTLIGAADDTIWASPATARSWLEVAARLVSEERGRPVRDPRWSAPMATSEFEREIRECRDLLHELLGATRTYPSDLRVAMVMLCAQVECIVGRRTEAAALLTKELDALTGMPEVPSESAALFLYRSAIEAAKGSIPEREEVDRILGLALRQGHRVFTAGALALRGLTDAVVHGAEGAGGAVTEAAEFIDTLSDAELATHPDYFAVLAWSEIFLGRLTSAQHHFVRGISNAHRAGRASSLAPLLNGMCYLALLLGPAAESDSAVAEAKALCERLRSAELSGMTLALEAANALWTNDLDSGQLTALAEEAIVTLQPGSSWSVSATLTLARALVIAGDPQRCTLLITSLGGGPELPSLPPLLRPLCYELLTLAAAQGELPSGADWAARTSDTADALKGHQPFQQAYAAMAQGHLRCRREHSAAAAYYRRAADLFAAAEMAGFQSTALILAAQQAAAAEQPAEASTLIVFAKDIARRCGATRAYAHAERLQDRWRSPSAGNRQRAAASTLAVLTDREREIAELAGTGRKTREIAEELVLSPRTVDVHLTRIYRKLGIGSRAALARLMTLAESPDDEQPEATSA